MSLPVETGAKRAYQYFEEFSGGRLVSFINRGGSIVLYVARRNSGLGVIIDNPHDPKGHYGRPYQATLHKNGDVFWIGIRKGRSFRFDSSSVKARMAGDLLIRCAESYDAKAPLPHEFCKLL